MSATPTATGEPTSFSAEDVGQIVPELAPPPSVDLDALTYDATAPPGGTTDQPGGAYVADYCVPRDWMTPHVAYAEHDRAVLDPTYMVPPDYVPPDLVSVSDAGFGAEQAGAQVRSIVIADLASLRADAEAAGAPLEVLSGYRSYAQQQATFEHWADVLGYDAAVRRAARPGHSEHQLGTVLDFSSPGWTGRFGDWALESPSGAWLAAHGWEYGFVMSYPNGGDAATCFGYEPWHFRWIGREAAADWRASGLTLHEFLVDAPP